MKEPLTRQQLRAIVSGRVQGVSFRYYTQQQAQQLGLVGYVRNLPAGTVEVVAEGEQEDLQALLRWLHQGPRLASVNEVREAWNKPTGQYRRFAVRL